MKYYFSLLITFYYNIDKHDRKKEYQNLELCYWKDLTLGAVETAQATDADGNVIYEVVYSKVIDNNSIDNADPVNNKITVSHIPGTVYTDILVTCLLDYGENITGQSAFDVTNNNNAPALKGATITSNSIPLEANVTVVNMIGRAGLLLSSNVTVANNEVITLSYASPAVPTTDTAVVSPNFKVRGYMSGDGTAPNGLDVSMGIAFPDHSKTGDYFLRLDYVPNKIGRASDWMGLGFSYPKPSIAVMRGALRFNSLKLFIS